MILSQRTLLSRPARFITLLLLAILICTLSFTLSFWSMAAPRDSLFTEQGTIGSFDFKTPGQDYTYALNYYIPNSVDLDHTAPNTLSAVLFLHGGGASTSSYSTAKNISQQYLKDFISYAKQKKLILLFPSSGIGWAFQTRFTIREALRLARTHLPINSNQVIISGHSMGAMGIGREYPYIADQAAGLLGLSGMVGNGYNETPQLRSVFNTPLTYLNGDDDHFEGFKPALIQFQKDVQAQETLLARPSKFNLRFRPGGHNYDLSLSTQLMTELLSHPRDLYQKDLFASFYGVDFNGVTFTDGRDSLPPFKNAVIQRYYWLELQDIATPILEQFIPTLEAHITGQTITLDMPNNALKSKILRVYLSNNMLKLSQPVTILLNGQSVYQGMVKTSPEQSLRFSQEKEDVNFIFDGAVDIKL